MDMEKLVSLCKRRGFIFPSSEVYGGLNGFWDYGPLGVELKRNIKDAWWRDNVTMRDDMAGLDCSIIMNPKVWEASGHVGGFSDPMVDCKKCNGRFRADQLRYIEYISSDIDPKTGEHRRVFFHGVGSVEELVEKFRSRSTRSSTRKPTPTTRPSTRGDLRRDRPQVPRASSTVRPASEVGQF